MLRFFCILATTLLISVSTHAQQRGDVIAKNDPVFMANIKTLKDTSPEAYKLLMKKIESGATIDEIFDYIGIPEKFR